MQSRKFNQPEKNVAGLICRKHQQVVQKILATNVTGNCWCDSFKIGIEKILSLARLLESTIADKIYETMSRNQAKLDRTRKL